MPAPKPFPIYPAKPLRHGGGARIKINQKSYYLGRHGSDESYKEYERLRAVHANNGTVMSVHIQPPGSLTIAALIAAWLDADPRGPKHREVIGIARACVPLRRLFGETAAGEFSTSRLIAVQEAMVSCSWMTEDERSKHVDNRSTKGSKLDSKGVRTSENTANNQVDARFEGSNVDNSKGSKPWSRQYINKQIKRIVRVFRWGEAHGHLPRGTFEHLRTISPLRTTDRRTRNTPKRKPVDWQKDVVPVLPFLSAPVKVMIELLLLIGARPGEIVAMRRHEVDTEVKGIEGVWLFTPSAHKTDHSGHLLVKVIGKRGQEILAPWLHGAEPTGYVFPPSKDRYRRGCMTVEGLGRAVHRACLAAKVTPWTCYQIRHLSKQLATRQFGLDYARSFLGQKSLGATACYAAQQDLIMAAAVAKEISA